MILSEEAIMAELTLFQSVVFLGCAGGSAALLLRAIYKVITPRLPRGTPLPAPYQLPD